MNSPEKINNDVLLVHGLGGWKSRLAIRAVVAVLNLRPGKHKIHLFNPDWPSNESAKDKLQRLDDYWLSKNRPPRLVGISAGANPVRHLALRNQEKISEVHLIAGWTGNSEDISERHIEQALAFGDVADITHALLAKEDEDVSKITQYIPLEDEVVLEKNMIIEGAQQINIPRRGHVPAISWSLLHQLPGITA
jgi:pimeloyl-ACP methyl ester carboxylesterase